MSEPLAATLLSGAVLAMFWAKDAVSARSSDGCCQASARSLAMVRPEYLGVACCLGLWCSRSGRGTVGGRALSRARFCWPGSSWSSRLGRSAMPSALDRFVPISTGGGQVLFAGTYLPSDGDPEAVGAEVVPAIPGVGSSDVRPTRAWSRSSARLAAAALSGPGKRQGAVADGPGTALGRRQRRAARIRGLRRRQDRPDLVARPARRDARAGLGGPALGLVAFGLLGLAILAWRRRWEALVLATIFLSITALSALLVASPRRRLVMLPLVAALAGVGAVFAGSWLRDRRSRPRPHPDG